MYPNSNWDVPGPLASDNPPTTLPELTFQAKALPNTRQRGVKLEYLVDLENYGPEEQCWVTAHDILDPLLICEYPAKNPEKPGPCHRVHPKQRATPTVSASGGGGWGLGMEGRAL